MDNENVDYTGNPVNDIDYGFGRVFPGDEKEVDVLGTITGKKKKTAGQEFIEQIKVVQDANYERLKQIDNQLAQKYQQNQKYVDDLVDAIKQRSQMQQKQIVPGIPTQQEVVGGNLAQAIALIGGARPQYAKALTDNYLGGRQKNYDYAALQNQVKANEDYARSVGENEATQKELELRQGVEQLEIKNLIDQKGEIYDIIGQQEQTKRGLMTAELVRERQLTVEDVRAAHRAQLEEMKRRGLNEQEANELEANFNKMIDLTRRQYPDYDDAQILAIASDRTFAEWDKKIADVAATEAGTANKQMDTALKTQEYKFLLNYNNEKLNKIKAEIDRIENDMKNDDERVAIARQRANAYANYTANSSNRTSNTQEIKQLNDSKNDLQANLKRQEDRFLKLKDSLPELLSEFASAELDETKDPASVLSNINYVITQLYGKPPAQIAQQEGDSKALQNLRLAVIKDDAQGIVRAIQQLEASGELEAGGLLKEKQTIQSEIETIDRALKGLTPNFSSGSNAGANGPGITFANTYEGLIDSAIGASSRYKNYKYSQAERWGSGRDCSSYMCSIFKDAGFNNSDVGVTAEQQLNKSTKVDKNKVRPGDFVFFKANNPKGNQVGRDATHVGMVIWKDGNRVGITHMSSSNSKPVEIELDDYINSTKSYHKFLGFYRPNVLKGKN